MYFCCPAFSKTYYNSSGSVVTTRRATAYYFNTAHGYLSTYNIVLVKYNQMLLKFLRFFAV